MFEANSAKTKTRVLLVDDDTELAAMLIEYLSQEGFAARAASDGEAAVREALSGTYEIMVLDIMMPGMSGVEALRKIRAQSQIPVLMLTAKGSQIDRIVGLELGADDYVPKPCAPRELVARLRAILRRSRGAASGDAAAISVGPLILSPQSRSVEWDGLPLELTSTEFNLLEVLARNAGRVVEKTLLSEQALGRPLGRFDRSIDVHMSGIRRKLPATESGRSPIQTVRGVGYQWIKE